MNKLEVGQGFRATYNNSPVRFDEMYQIGTEVEIKENGKIIGWATVNYSDHYGWAGLVSRVPEEKAAVVNRATKMELPKRENKAAAKPKAENKDSK